MANLVQLGQLSVFDNICNIEKPCALAFADRVLSLASTALGHHKFEVQRKGCTIELAPVAQRTTNMFLRFLYGLVAFILLPITFSVIVIKLSLMSTQQRLIQESTKIAVEQPSIELTTKSSRQPFVLFLDIDGVLYNPDQRAVSKKVAELFPNEEGAKNSNRMCSIAASHFFNKDALNSLDHLINEIEKTTKVWIVISSSWREGYSVEELRTTFFGIHNFSRCIVDKTPEEVPKDERLCRDCSGNCRGSQILSWLKQHPEIIDFAVLDDYDNHLSINFGEKFAKTKYSTLLTREISYKILMNYRK